MPRRPSRSRRLATAARWPLGVVLTSWRYMWRTTPMRRQEVTGSADDDGPPPLPPGVATDELQRVEDGTGPLFHRTYRVRIREADEAALSPEELVARIAVDPDRVAPREFATFNKVSGEDGSLRIGDEYVVRMPGPWDGPVRVVEVTPSSFRLATLRGHLEAGQIEFSTAARDEHVVFTIESWARSGDRLSSLLYERLRMAKEIQLHIWTSFLERVARLAGGRLTGGVEIRTLRVDSRAASDRRLEALRRAPLNFDPAELERPDPRAGWRVDDHRQPLPPEPPGPPVAGGSWEVASRLVRDYELADPGIVRALYRPDDAFEGRDMLLVLGFLGLRFRAGVRVDGAHDQ